MYLGYRSLYYAVLWGSFKAHVFDTFLGHLAYSSEICTCVKWMLPQRRQKEVREKKPIAHVYQNIWKRCCSFAHFSHHMTMLTQCKYRFYGKRGILKLGVRSHNHKQDGSPNSWAKLDLSAFSTLQHFLFTASLSCFSGNDVNWCLVKQGETMT